MRVVVVGSGGREHALAVSLEGDDHEDYEVMVHPGNAGIHHSRKLEVLPREADLFVVGPEKPLVDGMADDLRAAGRLVVGPGRFGARIEGSKVFMKRMLREANVPTAGFRVVCTVKQAERAIHELINEHGVVIKTDWLMGGKGVTVAPNIETAIEDARQKLASNHEGELVIEEALEGEEVSVMFLCDGNRAVPLPVAGDYKRLRDGGEGPNTGGMGGFCPIAETDWLRDVQEMADLTLSWCRQRECDYRGVLYAGVMLTPDGPKLLEWNIRFGDPEAQVILPLVANLRELLLEVAQGVLVSDPVIRPGAAVTVTLASASYPFDSSPRHPITGIERAASIEGVTVLHGATMDDGAEGFLSDGGRVLYPTAVGADVAEARNKVYEAVSLIGFEGMQYRTDIAAEFRRKL